MKLYIGITIALIIVKNLLKGVTRRTKWRQSVKLKKILWATDGSRESNSALRYAVFLARKFKAEILAIYVSEIQFPITSLYPISEEYILNIAETSEKKFETKFKRLSKKLSQSGIVFSHMFARDKVSDAIIKTAQKTNCDLIVMGKHGLGFFERSILGSNTAKVLRSSPVPVLSVKGKGRKEVSQISEILVPVDISDKSGSAILSSLEYAKVFNAKVTFLYVFWLNEKVYDVPPKLLKKLILKSKNELNSVANAAKKEWMKIKKNPEIDIRTEVISGINPGHAVCWYAKKMKFDLLIMNTHSRTGIKRLILGSEAEKIIRQSSCPVLVEKP